MGEAWACASNCFTGLPKFAVVTFSTDAEVTIAISRWGRNIFSYICNGQKRIISHYFEIYTQINYKSAAAAAAPVLDHEGSAHDQHGVMSGQGSWGTEGADGHHRSGIRALRPLHDCHHIHATHHSLSSAHHPTLPTRPPTGRPAPLASPKLQHRSLLPARERAPSEVVLYVCGDRPDPQDCCGMALKSRWFAAF